MYIHEFIIDKMILHNFLHSKYRMIMQLFPLPGGGSELPLPL